ncbi:hypothetical protein DH2020_038796 [Rehmannia glutinosa]|uniref:H15 domain-containing protein n=1 Tax=Rehmannia glutinosa TaxID=99300 RepID=A0ABR0UYU3_REHGL
MANEDLPPYPQMIMEAIDALDTQTEGANKSSISEYIESKYGEVPADHDDLLTTHLTKMKDNGELLLINNNYHKPAPGSPPPKRGRGRPPKPKDPLPSGTTPTPAAPSRPRGRPSKDPNAPPAAKKPKPSAGSTGRPRGRPRKVKPQGVENGVEA